MSAPAPNRPRPVDGGPMQYFLVILLAFGVISMGVNVYTGSEVSHQMSIIENFKDQHFIKSNSKSRKGQEDEPEDMEGVGKMGGIFDKKGDEDKDQEQKELEEFDKQDREEEEQQAAEADSGENDPEQEEENEETPKSNSELAGLKCEAHGGPSNEIAQQMVYWEDIDSDNTYVSPFMPPSTERRQYMTFESDHGGWNNIRMAMETCFAMAVAMGRTLVLPPEQGMYLLHKEKTDEGDEQRKHFSYNHFFHMEKIAEEHVGLEVITMDEFLQREALTGNLKDRKAREVAYPPNNRTKWDGAEGHELAKLEKYLRQVAIIPSWDPEKCMAAFPTTKDPKDVAVLQGIYDEVVAEGGFPSFEAYIDKPSPVDAPAKDRMKENWAGRDGPLCIYNEELQKAPVISFTSGAGSETTGEGARLLVHFYAFIFFEDWKQDLWLKRFVRDHVRYLDEIQCAAARVVNELQERARSRHPDTNPNGDFDTFHIRRGDFQYKVTRFEASKILEMSRPEMTPNATVYIATDERDRSFFKALADEYDIVFLDDFKHLLDGVNTNYYGMMDQLIASRGRIFFGCWFSTFTGYINRLRGYHANKEKKWKGYENGLVPSYYYALEDRKYHMQSFYPVKRSYYAREFPASWRGIDKGIGELQHIKI